MSIIHVELLRALMQGANASNATATALRGKVMALYPDCAGEIHADVVARAGP